MKKGAIFDVDGTMIDSMPIWSDAAARWLTGLGVQPAPDLGETLFRMSLDDGAAYLRNTYKLDLSDQDVKDGVLGVIRDFYVNEVPAKPGAGTFLAGLAALRIPMYLATSSNRGHVCAALERLGLHRYFRGMITCEEAGAGKSSPQIYLQAAKRLELPPEDIFVFEDVIHAVRTANSAGFVTVGVYDAASDMDNAAMRAECSIYLHTLEDFAGFCRMSGL
jgi:HAD superfamily hydrolase (TIGR01509 family)